jgi:hypothetical protein
MKGLTNEQIAYAAGRIQERLAIYAESLGTTAEFLTERVAAILHPLGSERGSHTMSRVPIQAPKLSQSKWGEMEESGNARSDKASTSSGRKRKSKSSKQKEYWAKMTPKQRTIEVARRLAVWRLRKKKAEKTG